MIEMGESTTGVFDAAKARSVNARFDPRLSGNANLLAANSSASGGLLGAGLSGAQRQARDILDMRAAGRAGDVTDEMMALADDQYMFANTPLDMGVEARMARADERDMIDGFHGTQPSYYEEIYNKSADNPDIVAFDVDRSTRGQSGKGIYFAPPDNYDLANSFAGGRKLSDADLEILDPNSPKIKGVVYPVKVRANKQADHQQMREAQYAYENQQIAEGKSSGYEGLSDSVFNTLEPQGFSGVSQKDEFTTFDPTNIRSRFARFDPEFAHLSNLSAANVSPTAGLLASGAQNTDKPLPFMEMLRGLLR
jgi:hypothetical protein